MRNKIQVREYIPYFLWILSGNNKKFILKNYFIFYYIMFFNEYLKVFFKIYFNVLDLKF